MQVFPFALANRHLFPDAIRRYYQFGGLLTILGLLIFSTLMYAAAYAQDTFQISCVVVGLIFTMIDLGYIAIWITNLKVINATYTIDEISVSNNIGTHTISAQLDGINSKNVEFNFYFGRGKMTIKYTILSKNGTVPVVCENESIYRIFKRLWGSDCIIVPA